MDLAYFLNKRLKFIEYFFASTTASFDEIKHKIEAGEPAYVDTRDPECAEEPAFLEEWENADVAVTITGAACLELLQSTFRTFLDEYMDQIGNKQVISKLKEMEKKSWFGNYRAFFHQYLKIDWTASGADVDLLEQVILTRNDFIHKVDLLSLHAFQTPFHSEKYPDSAFADPRWKTLSILPTRLTVPVATLQRAIAALRSLCEYLDHKRYAF